MLHVLNSIPLTCIESVFVLNCLLKVDLAELLAGWLKIPTAMSAFTRETSVGVFLGGVCGGKKGVCAFVS